MAYRSKAEERFANDLKERGIKFKYEPEKWDYKRKLVSSFCGACNHKEVYQRKKYTPDFFLPDYGFYIELKGRLTSRDRTKYIAVKRDNPDKDLRVICLADNKLQTRSTTRYSGWLEANSFTFHIGKTCPDDWLRSSRKEPARSRRKTRRGKEQT